MNRLTHRAVFSAIEYALIAALLAIVLIGLAGCDSDKPAPFPEMTYTPGDNVPRDDDNGTVEHVPSE